jgi:hypothetical protein
MKHRLAEASVKFLEAPMRWVRGSCYGFLIPMAKPWNSRPNERDTLGACIARQLRPAASPS